MLISTRRSHQNMLTTPKWMTLGDIAVDLPLLHLQIALVDRERSPSLKGRSRPPSNPHPIRTSRRIPNYKDADSSEL